jgi:hypothetical protein
MIRAVSRDAERDFRSARDLALTVYPEYPEARQLDSCRALFAFSGDAGEVLAKSAAPGFKFGLEGNRRS